jgi:hypothetical protein
MTELVSMLSERLKARSQYSSRIRFRVNSKIRKRPDFLVGGHFFIPPRR